MPWFMNHGWLGTQSYETGVHHYSAQLPCAPPRSGCASNTQKIGNVPIGPKCPFRSSLFRAVAATVFLVSHELPRFPVLGHFSGR